MKITPEQARSLAEQLLDGEDSILEGLPAPEDDTAPLPETIGGYRILRLIASGGMGRVYEAEQIQPRRIVAIKVLRQGLSSRSAQRRFEYESELLGALQHPGIGTVFEAGMHDDGKGGVPFFVMEFIPGARPITAYADEKGLDIRQRLELLTQACDAVQYGHQKGIIHRDLKPANILVGEEKGIEAARQQGNEEEGEGHEGTGLPDFKPSGLLPSPILKIIDFGIARATDSDIAVTTMHTEVGQLIGTLQYMSPEQCEGDPRKLDTRSDVYSLGVVLYELVCGRLPYDVSDTSIPHATRMIQESEPQRPSTISRKLKGDLETIALKALEKDREKRYQSAAELGADVRRYLLGEPIEAKSSTAWVKCARWIGQHPVTTTLATCLIIATLSISMIYVSVWYLNSKPHRVIINDDKTEVSIVSVAGKTIKTWVSQELGTFHNAEILDCPAEYEGGKLLLIGVNKSGLSELEGGLNVFRLNGPISEPWWRDEISDSEIPKSIFDEGYRGEQFNSRFADVFEIFSENPGKEIVVIGQHGPGSQCCIRIYSLDGQLLCQYWHDGNIHEIHWIEEEQLLVFGGFNGEVYWDQRGHPEIDYAHPLIIFALKPEMNFLDEEWIHDRTPAQTEVEGIENGVVISQAIEPG